MRNVYNIGAEITVDEAGSVCSIFSGSTAVVGSAIDRMPAGSQEGFMSAKLVAFKGIPTGAPSACSLTVEVGDSTGTSAPDETRATGTMSGTTAVDMYQANLNMLGWDRYAFVTVTPAFTGGSSPTVAGFAALILGGALQAPVTDDT